MLTCEECREQLYPENPEVAWYIGHPRRRLPPLCEGCSNRVSHPEESQESLIMQKQEPWNKNQWDIVNQLRGEVRNLLGKFLDLEQLVTSQGSKSRYKQYL